MNYLLLQENDKNGLKWLSKNVWKFAKTWQIVKKNLVKEFLDILGKIEKIENSKKVAKTINLKKYFK